MRAVVGQPSLSGTHMRVARGVLATICLLGAGAAPAARAQVVEPHVATPHAVTPRVVTVPSRTLEAPAAPMVPTSASDAPALSADTTPVAAGPGRDGAPTHQDGGGGGSHGGGSGGGDSGGSDSGGDGGGQGSTGDGPDPSSGEVRGPLRCSLYRSRFFTVAAFAAEFRVEYNRQVETYGKGAPEVDENLKYIADLMDEILASMPYPSSQERTCITFRPDR